MHAGFTAVAVSGSDHGLGSSGGEKRSGGDCAKGTPKNLLTGAVAVGSKVVVPMSTPDANVTVGFEAE